VLGEASFPFAGEAKLGWAAAGVCQMGRVAVAPIRELMK